MSRNLRKPIKRPPPAVADGSASGLPAPLPEPLVADLEARRFAWVVLDAELYPEPILAAIGRYYYLYEEYEINGAKQQLFAPGAE